VEEVEETLMWDHKIPFDRNGDTVTSNGQPLCRNCNNLKKQACGTCVRDTCEGCLFAFPEESANIVVLAMDEDTLARIRSYAASHGTPIPVAISELIKAHVEPVPVEKGSWIFR